MYFVTPEGWSSADCALSFIHGEMHKEIGNDIQRNAVEIQGPFRDCFVVPLRPVGMGGGK
jgi:hypothetical protein